MSKQFETVARWLDKLNYAETDETNNKTGDIVEHCGDDRFELIAKAKAELLDATNIESNPTDMAALDSILFRCWQMGWLDQLRTEERKGE